MNWDSKTNTWNDLKGADTKVKAAYAKQLKEKGLTTKEIAEKMDLSTSRINEYFRS